MIIFFKLKPAKQYTILNKSTASDKLLSSILSSPDIQIIGEYISIADLLYNSCDDYDFLVINASGKEFYMSVNYARSMSSLYVFDKKDGVISEVIVR